MMHIMTIMRKKFLFISAAVIIALNLYGCDVQNKKTIAQSAQPKESIQSMQSAQPTRSSSRYTDYSPEAFAAAKDKKRVYFFHAKWCPSCKAADGLFMSNLDQIPKDVMLFKTDYDTETVLKKKYIITYQHTFVYVDAAEKEVKKWNGGALAELIENTK